MRILSIVTLITPYGEYGGPVRVALNQAKELIAQGHSVTVAAGARGFDGPLPRTIDGVPVALFPVWSIIPGVGFAGLASPGLQRSLPALTRAADVVHVHVARDLVTLPAAAWIRRRGIAYVLQTHGMIDRSRNPLTGPLDALVTRRVLRAAKQVFYLTEHERRELIAVAGPDLRLRELSNGVPLAQRRADTHGRVEVLYLARLAARKRPAAFVQMAERLVEEFPNTSFRLIGPDEGEGDHIRSLLREAAATLDIRWDGALDPAAVTARMSLASIYVLPAVNEPYPMSVLEAMSIGLPVVITESCGLASVVRRSSSGIVVDETVDELVDAVASLLRDPNTARAMGDAGVRFTRESMSISSVAKDLAAAYVE